MELSKGLQQEIQLVQSKLKNAIRDHQICVGKLKDDPNNADLLGRIQEIQLHIVSLGRCQKQVVQRLRKEVEAFKAENTNEVKVSVASLLGLNNNNHITADNEATADEISEVKVVTNGLDNVRLADAKEDYEEIVRNGDVPTPTRNSRNKKRSLSVETLSAEDDVIEVAIDEDSREKRRQEPEIPTGERKVNIVQQLNFLEVLGLITTMRFTELQNKRAERKRRSTANPQFVYSNWELPTKRKRHNYLQSACNVPQTRQTTARLNGPSPPPTNNKTTSVSAPTGPPPKSTSPPSRTIAKSLIPTQKATTRPNILRNMSESRVFPTKSRTENGTGQVQLPSSTKNSQQSIGKTVHIPGLPPSLTIERIENDTAVCINCRNPGTLTNCENCEANYHVSCHIISPAPPGLCPKCALKIKDETGTTTATTTTATSTMTSTTIKKNEELEEKERERYEQRERNSDLRLQVYELEKRSQLLGQSLQLQHRTRQELLGKQEKTQRSIKRLVDFIKLVQLRNNNSSSTVTSNNSSNSNSSVLDGGASTSYHPRLTSSRSPRTPSPSRLVPISPTALSPQSPSRRSTSTSPISIAPPSALSPTAMTYPTMPRTSSTISYQTPESPTSSSPSPKSPLPTNSRSVETKRSGNNHITSSKRSQNQECKTTVSKQQKSKGRRSSTVSNSRQHQDMLSRDAMKAVVGPVHSSPKSRSPMLRYNSTTSPDVSPSRSPGAGKSPPPALSPVSIGSSTRTTSRSQSRLSTRTTTTWTNYRAARTTEDSRRSENNNNSLLISCVESDEPRCFEIPETSTSPGNNSSTWKSQDEINPGNSKRASSPVGNTDQNLAVYSTHCSQAITSPIPSPIILMSRSNQKIQQQQQRQQSTEEAQSRSTKKTSSPASNCLETRQQKDHTVPTSPHPPNT